MQPFDRSSLSLFCRLCYQVLFSRRGDSLYTIFQSNTCCGWRCACQHLAIWRSNSRFTVHHLLQTNERMGWKGSIDDSPLRRSTQTRITNHRWGSFHFFLPTTCNSSWLSPCDRRTATVRIAVPPAARAVTFPPSGVCLCNFPRVHHLPVPKPSGQPHHSHGHTLFVGAARGRKR